MQITCPFEINRNEITLHIPDGAITAFGLADDSVENRHMASGAVGASAIEEGSIEFRHITVDPVLVIQNQNLADAIITSAKLGLLAVDTEHLAALAVEAGQLATGAVEGDKLAVNAIVAGSAAIAVGAIGAAMIGNAEIIDAKIDRLSANKVRIRDADIERIGANKLVVINADIQSMTAAKISAGTITGSTLQTAVFGQGPSGNRFVVSAFTGEARFYGDRGDSTIELLATIGITGSPGDQYIGYFGSLTSEHVAIRAESKILNAGRFFSGVFNVASSFPTIQATHLGGITTNKPAAIALQSLRGYGFDCAGSGETTYAGNCLGVSTWVGSGSPDVSDVGMSAKKGSLMVNTDGKLYINTNGSTGWDLVGAQT